MCLNCGRSFQSEAALNHHRANDSCAVSTDDVTSARPDGMMKTLDMCMTQRLQGYHDFNMNSKLHDDPIDVVGLDNEEYLSMA